MKKFLWIIAIAAIGGGLYLYGNHLRVWVKTIAMGPGESSGEWFVSNDYLAPDYTRSFFGREVDLANLQGLEADGWRAFLRADQGSALAPYDLFVNLETANDDDLFIGNRNMAALRYISSPKSDSNPDALPIGFSKTEHAWKGEYYAGLTCAACHSGLITQGGTTLFVLGGATMADFEGMTEGLSEALNATLKDDAKFDRLADRMGYDDPTGRADLRTVVQTTADEANARVKINATEHAYGFGRVDAVGQIYNQTTAVNLDIKENIGDANAPVSYPFLWGSSQSHVVQWTGFAPNFLPAGVLLRNAGEVLGVFGRIDLEDRSEPLRLGRPSSVNVLRLGDLGDWVNRLEPPAWPEDTLGEIDADKAAAGKKIYADLCVSCHELVTPFQTYRAKLIAAEKIGTDPLTVRNSLAKGVNKHGHSRLKLIMAIEQAFEAVAYHPSDALAASKKEALADKIGLPGFDTYKARPLNGIWASPPYLHNGSVPSLAALLLPAHERPKSFTLGWWEFDPENVGYQAYEGDDAFLFDTSLPGNGNQGHEGADMGTHLSPQERAALVEYLKTL